MVSKPQNLNPATVVGNEPTIKLIKYNRIESIIVQKILNYVEMISLCVCNGKAFVVEQKNKRISKSFI